MSRYANDLPLLETGLGRCSSFSNHAMGQDHVVEALLHSTCVCSVLSLRA